MQVKRIAECSKGSILEYFRPLLSYHLSLRFLFCIFLSGCFTQVLLYTYRLHKINMILREIFPASNRLKYGYVLFNLFLAISTTMY